MWHRLGERKVCCLVIQILVMVWEIFYCVQRVETYESNPETARETLSNSTQIHVHVTRVLDHYAYLRGLLFLHLYKGQTTKIKRVAAVQGTAHVQTFYSVPNFCRVLRAYVRISRDVILAPHPGGVHSVAPLVYASKLSQICNLHIALRSVVQSYPRKTPLLPAPWKHLPLPAPTASPPPIRPHIGGVRPCTSTGWSHIRRAAHVRA